MRGIVGRLNVHQPNPSSSGQLIATRHGMLETREPLTNATEAADSQLVDGLKFSGAQSRGGADDQHIAILKEQMTSRDDSFDRFGGIGVRGNRLHSVSGTTAIIAVHRPAEYSAALSRRCVTAGRTGVSTWGR
jgi:hypothetical protein